MSFFQTFEVKPEPVAIPFQYFYAVAASVAEYKHCPVTWVKFETSLHNGDKPVDAFPHVCLTAGEKYPFSGKA
ncbi:hypothetical protein JCM39194_00030 [Desulfotomaculum varum]